MGEKGRKQEQGKQLDPWGGQRDPGAGGGVFAS